MTMRISRNIQVVSAILLIAAGVLLSAAAQDPGLPDDYWDAPGAGLTHPPGDWSKLESQLHPEACASCHAEQFESWKHSLHAASFSPGLIGQFPGMGDLEANECLNCHAPLAEQAYRDSSEMNASLVLKLKQSEGFDPDGELHASAQPLRHSGVNCAVCHVRAGKRFGPPPKQTGSTGFHATGVHGGFMATKAFEQSQFCASCHQFPQSMAINGKPMENTLTEWKQSRFSRQGVTCQQCHMPDRKHEFRGIHDVDMVRKGVEFSSRKAGNSAELVIHSTWIGHAFPTYVTPKVIVLAQALDAAGRVVKHQQWEIVREVHYEDGWRERRDTRLMPGERRRFMLADIPDNATGVRFRVTVQPDYFYKGIYRSLLSEQLKQEARALVVRALKQASHNDYILFEQLLK